MMRLLPHRSVRVGVAAALWPVRAVAIASALGISMAAGGAELPEDSSTRSARTTLSGLGWLGNLQMKALLRQSRTSPEAPAVLDADTVEDGAFLVLNHAHDLGYLQAVVTSEILLVSGETLSVVWRDHDLEPLPRPLAVREIRYRVNLGPRHFYESLEFRGLTVLDEDAARPYFVRTDGLLSTRALRRFSRDELSQAVGALREALRNLGYAKAKVTAAAVDLDGATGAARVVIEVEEGPRHRVREVQVVVRDTPEGSPVDGESRRPPDRLLSRPMLEDLEQELLARWFREGYPDAAVRIATGDEVLNAEGEVEVDLRAGVIRGPRVRLGAVRFVGAGFEPPGKPLLRRTRLEGPWLDRLAVDEARARIARLGGVRFIHVDYEPSPDDPTARDPVFKIEPARRFSVDLLMGFRSYELLYGGFEVSRRNLFDLGHSADLRVVQSFKSTEGSATYSIPDVFTDDLTLFGQVQFLTRQEISFRREEYRSGVGLRRVFEGTGHEVGVRYAYELLKALDAPVDLPRTMVATDRQWVSSVALDWTYDRRDSAVAPRRGFDTGVTLELAAPELGGDARYLRPELRASGHLPLGQGRFVHAGLRGSLVTDPGDTSLVPFNKRFFPGGDDSVRGYLRGEAAPLNAAGEIIGAEAALIWNLELEQLLTPSWSVLLFVDGVAQTSDLGASLAQEDLWSAGVGLRWNTAIGPVRVEYGHNLNPRSADPSGTVHFSVGVPF